MSYDLFYEFPLRYLNEQMIDLLHRCTQYREDTIKEMKEALTEESFEPGIGRIKDDDNNRGEIDELEAYFRQHQIPFDLWCSEGEGNGPDMKIYRPELGYDERLLVDFDGDNFIHVSALSALLQSTPDHLLRQELETLMQKDGAYGVPLISHYAAETKIGRDPLAMDSIESVLEELDDGKITQEEAMSRITEITQKGAENPR